MPSTGFQSLINWVQFPCNLAGFNAEDEKDLFWSYFAGEESFIGEDFEEDFKKKIDQTWQALVKLFEASLKFKILLLDSNKS